MKGLVASILVIGFALTLVYFLVPVDVYYAPSSISAIIFRSADWLNHTILIFPSKVIFILEDQHYLGFMRYLGSAKTLAVLLLPGIFLGRRKLLWWLVLSPLIFLEIIYRLGIHDIDSVLVTPFFVVGIFFVARKFRLATWLTFLAALLLTFDSWRPVLENFVYNKLFLWPLPIRPFEDLNILLMILMVVFLVGAGKATRIILVGYILVTLLLPSKQEWIWTKENLNDQYLLATKEFVWPGFLPKKLSVQISAKSVYKLYLNGNYVGEGPGPNDDRRRYFDEYEAGKWLKPGKNEIKILAYNYGHDTHFQKKQTGGLWANFIFPIGPVQLSLPTNKTWRLTSDTGFRRVDLKKVGIKDYEINSGLYHEEFDFSIEPKIYTLAAEYPVTDSLLPKDYPILVSGRAEPEKVIDANDGKWLEFANVVAGFPEFSFETSGKALVEVKYFEEPGSSLVQWDDFYIPGPGKFTHEGFGRRGFRVVQLVVKEGKVEKISMGVRTIRYPAPEVGTFASDNGDLIKYWQIGVDTLRYGLQDQYEDSFVHERSQYLGDSYVDMLAGFYSLNSQDLARKALYQFASSQRSNGVVETVYPSGLNQTIASYNLLFSQFLRDYYLYSGNRQTVVDLLPNAEKIVAGMDKLKGSDGLINQRNLDRLGYSGELVGWVDHLAADQPGADGNLVFDALYYEELSSIADLYSGINTSKAEEYLLAAALFRERLTKYLQGVAAETIEPHAAVLLVRAGILDGSGLININRPFVTAYFDFFYLQALEKAGDTNTMLKVLREQWGGMIDRGARTTWDIFDPGNKGFIGWSMTHAWSSGATYFLTASGAGIRPLAPGYKKILIRPNFISTEMAATVDAACGKIAVDWRLTGTDFNLNLKTSCRGGRRYELPLTEGMILRVTVNGQSITPTFIDNRLVIESAGNDEVEAVSVGLRV